MIERFYENLSDSELFQMTAVLLSCRGHPERRCHATPICTRIVAWILRKKMKKFLKGDEGFFKKKHLYLLAYKGKNAVCSMKFSYISGILLTVRKIKCKMQLRNSCKRGDGLKE
jgi:hypothetical protein